MITVFYDKKCGICSKEINHYRKIAPEGIFDWKDIISSTDEIEKEGLKLIDVLKIFHVKDTGGHWHKGVDGFLLIWKNLDRWRYLGKLVCLPIFYQLACFAYAIFARWRFKRLDHCKVVAEE
ncbi:thiol-disulfide oxidoreductase [PVC group bacterium (ex Bugula neritina AB1)]|nr:thiol-disulfide oxidoreductase [PVC group bacterium (ex Bugula neritina AB1)]